MGNAICFISQPFFFVDNKNIEKSSIIGHEDIPLVINTDVIIEEYINVPKAPSGKKLPEFS